MTPPSVFERLRQHKKELALPAAVTAIVLAGLAIVTLNHDAPLSVLKELYLFVDAVLLAVALLIRSIRASVAVMVSLVAICTM